MHCQTEGGMLPPCPCSFSTTDMSPVSAAAFAAWAGFTAPLRHAPVLSTACRASTGSGGGWRPQIDPRAGAVAAVRGEQDRGDPVREVHLPSLEAAEWSRGSRLLIGFRSLQLRSGLAGIWLAVPRRGAGAVERELSKTVGVGKALVGSNPTPSALWSRFPALAANADSNPRFSRWPDRFWSSDPKMRRHDFARSAFRWLRLRAGTAACRPRLVASVDGARHEIGGSIVSRHHPIGASTGYMQDLRGADVAGLRWLESFSLRYRAFCSIGDSKPSLGILGRPAPPVRLHQHSRSIQAPEMDEEQLVSQLVQLASYANGVVMHPDTFDRPELRPRP